MLNTKLIGLMKYASLSLDQLTPKILQDVISAFGYERQVDEKLFHDVTDTLRNDDVDKLADIIQRPDIFNKVIPLLKAPEQEGMDMIICPHCNGFVSLDS